MDGGHLNQKPTPKPKGGKAMKLDGYRLGTDAEGKARVERFDDCSKFRVSKQYLKKGK
jgi:hypothetical protein